MKIKKRVNEIIANLNNRFLMKMRIFPPHMRSNEFMEPFLYFGEFYSKLGYCLQDKNPQILREAYAMTSNIERI
jgi:hypothetical protein